MPAVDGNVLRVFARILNDGRDVTRPDVKKDLTACVMELQPPERPGDYNQALMELGALVCLPGGAPLCSECPLRGLCAARALGVQETLPVKAPPAAKRTQHWTVALVLDMENRRVLLQQRPQKGLLAGLWQPVLLEGARSCTNRAGTGGARRHSPRRGAFDARPACVQPSCVGDGRVCLRRAKLRASAGLRLGRARGSGRSVYTAGRVQGIPSGVEKILVNRPESGYNKRK